MGVIRLPNGQLRDELPYSLVYKGREQVSLIDPMEYFNEEKMGLISMKEKVSLRLKEIQILSSTPVSILLLRLVGEATTILGKWSSLETDKYSFSDPIDFHLGLYGITRISYGDTPENVVFFNGILRRPVD